MVKKLEPVSFTAYSNNRHLVVSVLIEGRELRLIVCAPSYDRFVEYQIILVSEVCSCQDECLDIHLLMQDLISQYETLGGGDGGFGLQFNYNILFCQW